LHLKKQLFIPAYKTAVTFYMLMEFEQRLFVSRDLEIGYNPGDRL
jgi:hypothetical protein